jgi:hypothetical protein
MFQHITDNLARDPDYLDRMINENEAATFIGYTKVAELSQIDDPAELAARARLLRDHPLAASDLPAARLDEVEQAIRDRGYGALSDLPPKEAAAVRRASYRDPHRAAVTLFCDAYGPAGSVLADSVTPPLRAATVRAGATCHVAG